MSAADDFPKWKYHATEAACVVDDAKAEKALKGKWYDSPADVPGADALPELTTRQKLEADAAQAGVQIDPAWSDEQIVEAILAKGKV